MILRIWYIYKHLINCSYSKEFINSSQKFVTPKFYCIEKMPVSNKNKDKMQ